ncbi:nucleoside hydrolase [Solihabitans fulvus]|uniref:Nucleoside hydrolase n=1 Tax=Solihabitans fulvus TaxID=1892852 RepID=A0A5B2X9K7_9PSEU|nr:nucleoside hydrolase [Solihabitans fulvus]KAA2259532.1 nucleoside hydrolase [Solihabitans fulvus]
MTTRTPLIIDTDPGVDDAFALALAAASPEVDLLAVTTVFGNVPLSATTVNARRLLALLGREDVPVAAGADRPLVHPHPHRARYAHGSDGLSGRSDTLPEPTRALDPRDAVTLMTELLAAATAPVTIAAVGPLTNVALLLAAHPWAREKIGRLVIMGGAVGGGNVSAAAEFNIWSDPEAARRVLAEERLPTVLVPLDLTMRCAVDLDWLGRVEAAGPVGAALVGLTAEYQRHYAQSLGWPGLVLHDAVAVAEAVRPGILRTTRYPVDVDCTFGPGRGATVADRRRTEVNREYGVDQEQAVDFALDTDLDGLRQFVLDRLSTL